MEANARRLEAIAIRLPLSLFVVSGPTSLGHSSTCFPGHSRGEDRVLVGRGLHQKSGWGCQFHRSKRFKAVHCSRMIFWGGWTTSQIHGLSSQRPPISPYITWEMKGVTMGPWCSLMRSLLRFVWPQHPRTEEVLRWHGLTTWLYAATSDRRRCDGSGDALAGDLTLGVHVWPPPSNYLMTHDILPSPWEILDAGTASCLPLWCSPRAARREPRRIRRRWTFSWHAGESPQWSREEGFEPQMGQEVCVGLPN